MLKVEEVFVGGAAGSSKLHSKIFPKLKKAFALPGLRHVKPVAKRVAGVAEVPGRLSIHSVEGDLAAAADKQALTVISANLWHDWPKFRQIYQRLEVFAQLVQRHQADVLLLQEVTRTPDLRVDHWLAERLGMSFVYSRANGHQQGIGFEEGVAIFSRYPLSRPTLRQLSPAENPFSRRMALGTRIATPFGDFQAFSVHLGISRKQNIRQAEQLRNWVQEISGHTPALVGGDFNAGEFSGSIKRLRNSWLDTFRQMNPFADGTTHEIRWPWGKALKRSRLDYIFLKAEQKKWEVLEALHLETPGAPHSDHRAVLLRLAPAFAVVQDS